SLHTLPFSCLHYSRPSLQTPCPPLLPPLSPYTTLFRSQLHQRDELLRHHRGAADASHPRRGDPRRHPRRGAGAAPHRRRPPRDRGPRRPARARRPRRRPPRLPTRHAAHPSGVAGREAARLTRVRLTPSPRRPRTCCPSPVLGRNPMPRTSSVTLTGSGLTAAEVLAVA